VYENKTKSRNRRNDGARNLRYRRRNYRALYRLRHGSLFSGIGGFDLAATWAGWQNIFQVEKDEFCTAVLKKNFPNVTRYRDIRDTNFKIYNGLIDVLSGGFPCQPFSDAGERRGVDDDRYLWPEFERAVAEIMPAWVIAENVNGIRKLALDLVCSSLEDKGYTVRPISFPASAVGAWQRRERTWIVARNADITCERCKVPSVSGGEKERKHVTRNYWENGWPEIVAEFCRDPPRLPGRVDRIKSLGNSIVPQVATRIFNLINEIES
jgi:DNA (cytosine-5)-methyltransferase 1